MKNNKIEIVKVTVGFDQREAIAYHTFCQSLISNATIPLQIIPLAKNNLTGYNETHTDQSNDFIYSRFLTPYLCNFEGWAIFFDGDMICQSDIKNLWEQRDPGKAIMVVKHEYKTKQSIKYLGNKNENYPRKNWSSVIMWNCEHPKHKILTPDFIAYQTGKFLHRFSWLDDNDIGELQKEWNWLAIEYPEKKNAHLIHFTLGTPCFKEYKNTDMSEIWYENYYKTQEGFDK